MIKLIYFKLQLPLKPHILFHSNGLAIKHALSDIRPIEVNNGRLLAILNSIKFKIFRVHLLLKPHNLLDSNGLAI